MSARAGLALLLLVALVAAAPFALPWAKIILTIALAKGLAVLGVIVLLQAGQVSFGHAMFFAAGAYAAGFLTRAYGGLDIAILLPAAILISGVFALLVGLFVVRYRYIFFSMLNLAFSMVLYSVLEKFFHITNGSDGLRVERPAFFGFVLERGPFEWAFFYFSLALVVLLALIVHRYLASPLGQALKAMKTNETRLEYLGLSARSVLLAGYVLSGVLCGVGGLLLAVMQGLTTPEFAYWVRSGEFVFIAILGGAAHVAGAFVGAFVYEVVRTYAAAFAADAWQMVLGIILLAIILFAPRGIVGLVQSRAQARRAGHRGAEAPAGDEMLGVGR